MSRAERDGWCRSHKVMTYDHQCQLCEDEQEEALSECCTVRPAPGYEIDGDNLGRCGRCGEYAEFTSSFT